MSKEATKYVRFTFDPANPPRMTPEEQARFDAIREEDIDYSDIPDQGGFTDWTRPGSIVAGMERRRNGAKKQPAASANGSGKRKAHAR